MAEIGAELSIGELSLEALARISDRLGSVHDLFATFLKRQELYEKVGPVQLQLLANGNAPAAGDLLLDLGGPSYGRRWEVRQLAVGGLTYSTAASGTAELYTGSSVSALNRSLAGLSDRAAALPSNAFYGSGQVTLRNPERLFVVIVAPTAGQTYVANGAGFDMPDIAALRTFGE